MISFDRRKWFKINVYFYLCPHDKHIYIIYKNYVVNLNAIFLITFKQNILK